MNCILVQTCVCAVLCTVLCFYIAERALYMYVHDLANPLLFADNVMFQQYINDSVSDSERIEVECIKKFEDD